MPPLNNSDGSMLTDLAGYRVYYGMDPNRLDQVIDLSVASSVVYTVGNLARGTWYFTISSYTTQGVEGDPSPMVDATIS
jgi:hypothetical protein